MSLSISDAFSSVRFIYGIVSQVKENREELMRVSTRLEHILRCLEDSSRRDLIQPQEYTDAMTTVSFMIEKTQIIVRRQLKRSLGDRTWRRDEIKSEIKRLSDDVQNYLSVHTIKVLDMFQASNNQQLLDLSDNMQEMMIKLAAIDIRLGTPTGPEAPWSSTIVSKAQETIIDLQTRPTSDMALDDALSSADIGKSLAAAGSASLQIIGLKRRGEEGPGTHSITLNDVKSNTTYHEIITEFFETGYEYPWWFKEDDLVVTVSDSVSQFDATAPGGLQISRSVPLLHWWNKYEEYHGLGRHSKYTRRSEGQDAKLYHPSTTPGHTLTEICDGNTSISVCGVKFSFHRTLRVPDKETPNNLPPSFGRFPLLPVSRFSHRLPETIVSKGGFILPIFQREALWISFQSITRPAVKVSVGTVNVISGCAKDCLTPPETNQDYIIAGKQIWLDGVKTESEGVRQFVAMPLGSGYTVEEQVTGESQGGGFQFDVFPRRNCPKGNFIHHTASGNLPLRRDLTGTVTVVYSIDPKGNLIRKEPPGITLRWDKTPEELGLADGALIQLETSGESGQKGWTLSDYRRRIGPLAALSAIYYRRDFSGLSQDGYLVGRTGGRHPAFSSLGVGGTIRQKIYPDDNSPRTYDEENGHRFYVHMISPESWEAITGTVPPITPITPATYQRHHVPWFSLSDDYMGSLQATSGALRKLRSVKELDEARLSPPALIDPDHPPQCSRHNHRTSVVVFRPCSHVACSACLGEALLNSSICPCGVSIARMVGMKKPVSQVTEAEDADEEHESTAWNVSQLEGLAVEAADSKNITIIHLEKDRVSPLFSRAVKI